MLNCIAALSKHRPPREGARGGAACSTEVIALTLCPLHLVSREHDPRRAPQLSKSFYCQICNCHWLTPRAEGLCAGGGERVGTVELRAPISTHEKTGFFCLDAMGSIETRSNQMKGSLLSVNQS